ncbi:membrane-associated protein, putative [Bodo saltans]|uniref:Membrane-associated protein, putative n=1 Tax=Bodo saltans TaxID=75058 RepID=A0A0S4KE94_BODSA|nr:membrane-associated protein, putative [Bodo saltans]|eukprot:CUI13116.1 membrane-associated protein, putative [Bodo saltans]
MKRRRIFNVVTTILAAAGTVFLLISMITPYVVEVRGDTASLEGGQKFNGGFGYFAVCDNVRSLSQTSTCGLVTSELIHAVDRFKVVTNYIDRMKCLNRDMEGAEPYLRTSQAFVIFGLMTAILGTLVAAFMTFFRPRDVAVLSIQAKWKRKIGWNPLLSSVLLLAFLFESWIGCNQTFCDVCHYAQDCSCHYGASMVFSVLAMFCLFLSGLLMFIRWFRMIGGSSVECPCSD